eukprot:Nk52_evm16s2011 gene=Nk52_evmTU16s2011
MKGDVKMEKLMSVLAGDGELSQAGALELSSYVTAIAQTFSWPDVEQKHRCISILVDIIANHGANSEAAAAVSACLKILTFFCREKSGLEKLQSSEGLQLLMGAVLEHSEDSSGNDVSLEAIKCLNNLLFANSATTASFVSVKGPQRILEIIRKRVIEETRDGPPLLADGAIYFACRLMFIVAASQGECVRELTAPEHLNDFVDLIGVLCARPEALLSQGRKSSPRARKVFDSSTPLPPVSMALIEALKCLYCIMAMGSGGIEDSRKCKVFEKLSAPLNSLVTSSTHLYWVNVIHLLTVAPFSIRYLFAGETDDGISSFAMNCVDFYDHQCNSSENQMEGTVPILSVMRDFSKACRPYRKTLRNIIFPHQKDVKRRPEERKNRGAPFVKSMTSSTLEIKLVATDLLFVLCKEDANVLVRRTGFGNAAGFLAEHGLLSPAQEIDTQSGEGNYSDASMESEDGGEGDMNPVTACTSKPDEENQEMTYEEKEAEAQKVMDMLERLESLGVMRAVALDENNNIKELK